jgi:hypothetical protein
MSFWLRLSLPSSFLFAKGFLMDRRDSLKLLLAASCSSILPPWLSAARRPPAASAIPSDDAKASSQIGRDKATQAIAPVFTWLAMGEVKPAGWIKEQMMRDLNEGFAGRLDELCPEASSDIFASHRNSGSAEDNRNSARINWWNGETEGNWRSGFLNDGLSCRRQRGNARGGRICPSRSGRAGR